MHTLALFKGTQEKHKTRQDSRGPSVFEAGTFQYKTEALPI
jgi:hypothetical protein